jgi:hypothetical protein
MPRLQPGTLAGEGLTLEGLNGQRAVETAGEAVLLPVADTLWSA